MSIKVYTGFELETGNLEEVVRIVETFRMTVEPLANKMIDDFIDRGGKFSDWLDAASNIKRTGLRDPMFDTQCDLLLIPFEGRFIGIMYCEHSKWFQKWLEMPLVKPFMYWNNSDPDEDASASEWKRREKTWEKALGSRIPAMVGFNICVTDPNGPLPKRLRE